MPDPGPARPGGPANYNPGGPMPPGPAVADRWARRWVGDGIEQAGGAGAIDPTADGRVGGAGAIMRRYAGAIK